MEAFEMESPALAATSNRANNVKPSLGFNRPEVRGVGLSLQAEIKAWRADKALPLGPVNADNFVLQFDGKSWTLHVRPLKGLPETITGLTAGEANRKRIELCSEGFIGKVVGGAL